MISACILPVFLDHYRFRVLPRVSWPSYPTRGPDGGMQTVTKGLGPSLPDFSHGRLRIRAEGARDEVMEEKRRRRFPRTALHLCAAADPIKGSFRRGARYYYHYCYCCCVSIVVR